MSLNSFETPLVHCDATLLALTAPTHAGLMYPVLGPPSQYMELSSMTLAETCANVAIIVRSRPYDFSSVVVMIE